MRSMLFPYHPHVKSSPPSMKNLANPRFSRLKKSSIRNSVGQKPNPWVVPAVECEPPCACECQTWEDLRGEVMHMIFENGPFSGQWITKDVKTDSTKRKYEILNNEISKGFSFHFSTKR